MKEEFKQILFEVFSVLGFSDAEKDKALESFKRKFAAELLNSMKDKFSVEQQEWINGQSGGSELKQDEPKFIEIQQTIKELYPEEELYQKSKEIFRKLLEDYVQFMSSDLESDKTSKLNDLLARV